MATSVAISRRNMLVLGGVAVAAAALPASFALFEREKDDVADDLLSMLSDPAGAAEIGKHWIEADGHAADDKTVANRIAKRLRAFGWRPGDPPATMHAALAARVRHDFEHGDMVDVDGWQISRTGVELCALAALSAGAAKAG